MKTCRGCGEAKALSEFYTHPQMGDGHLNFCKSCVRQRTQEHRHANIERYRAYDVLRSKEPQRRKRMTEITTAARVSKGYGPAHCVVWRAKKAGVLVPPIQCPTCGAETRLVAHHTDYAKPLDVEWMCQACHVGLHTRTVAA